MHNKAAPFPESISTEAHGRVAALLRTCAVSRAITQAFVLERLGKRDSRACIPLLAALADAQAAVSPADEWAPFVASLARRLASLAYPPQAATGGAAAAVGTAAAAAASKAAAAAKARLPLAIGDGLWAVSVDQLLVTGCTCGMYASRALNATSEAAWSGPPWGTLASSGRYAPL